jgi:hypothetical protein
MKRIEEIKKSIKDHILATGEVDQNSLISFLMREHPSVFSVAQARRFLIVTKILGEAPTSK